MERMTLSVAEVQQALGVGRNTVYELVNRSDFPKIRVGRKIIVPRDAFAKWLERQTEQVAG